MKLVLTVEIEVFDINRKADVYDKLIATDRITTFIEHYCGCGLVTDITLKDKEEDE